MKRLKYLLTIVFDGVKIIHRLDPWKMPVQLLRALFVSTVPFVVVILSAEIINRLSSGAAYQDILIFAIVSVCVIFALTFLGDYFKKANDVKTNHCRRLYDFSKNIKMMDMDFAELENPSTSNLRTKLRAEENMGFSLPLLFTCLDILAESLFMVLLSLALLLPTIISAKGLPIVGVLIFIVISITLSIIVSVYRKRVDDIILKQIKDDNFWPDVLLESDAMAFGSSFSYRDGKDVRIYGFQDSMRKRFNDSLKFMLKVAKNFATAPALAHGLVGAVNGLIMGGSFIFVSVFASDGNVAFGTVILLASLLYQFTFGLSRTVTTSATIFSVSESIQTYMLFTSAKNTVQKGVKPVDTKRIKYDITFRNVSFKYPGCDRYVLRNLSFDINMGKRLAVVGMNGSGKTTIVKLLCRLYEPTEGEILLDGININEYSLAEYQALFSVVFQDFILFSLEIGQVISASLVYDIPRVEACLHEIGMGARFSAMPQGVKTPLYKDYDDGVEVSGGEAQKIALARALHKDAPFIILDEPTAALDPISEYEVYAKINDIAEGKTAIFISHRLSSCRFCDDIAVFHEGNLIQRGSHDELILAGNGKYCELWNAQAQYYVDK
jgi:ATP-binding cassette subfamily B protein